MSRKDRLRAIGGNPHPRDTPSKKAKPGFVCAHCHKPGFLLKSGNYYYHEKCPKEMIPLEVEGL